MALPPCPVSFLSAASFFASLVPQMHTLAPAWARASAMPRPMPLLPPVTSATLPVRSKPRWLMSLLSLSPLRRGQPVVVTHELDIAGAQHGARALEPVRLHGALPLPRPHVQLLIGEPRLDLQSQTTAEIDEPPARRIADAGALTPPRAARLHPHVAGGERARAPPSVHDDAGAPRRGPAILP